MKVARLWKIPELETSMLFVVKNNRTKRAKANKSRVTNDSSSFSIKSLFLIQYSYKLCLHPSPRGRKHGWVCTCLTIQ